MKDSVTVLDIRQLEGIGPVRLGSDRASAREALLAIGFPLNSSRVASDYFCKSSIQIEYGPDGRVWFIGVSASVGVAALLRGQDVFALSAPELFSLVATSDGSGPHTYNHYEYRFPHQILTLWGADTQYDRQANESRPVWGQVGVGNTSYAAAIAAIKSKV